MSKAIFSKSILAAAIAAAASATPSALAQDEKVLKLEEVLVTATRVERNLQEVPISVAVLSGDDLDLAGAVSFADIGFSAGNFVANESANDPTIGGVSIRGIRGRAGVYVDDVLQGNGVSVNSTLVDVERIEILRGPQGTTFGANTIAGAVNTITREPSFEFTGTADVTFGDYGFEQYRGSVSGPLIEDTLAGKISGFSRESDGADEQIGTGDDISGDDEWGVRGSVLWLPGDNLKIRLDASYSDLDIDDAQNYDFLNATVGSLLDEYQSGAFADQGYDNDPFPANTSADDRKIWETTETNNVYRESTGYSAKIEWEYNDIDIVSITAYQDIDSGRTIDEDRIPTYLAQNDADSNYKQFTQEIRLSGSTDRLNWLGGFFYLDSEETNDGFLTFSPLLLLTAAGLPSGFAGVGGAETTNNETDVTDWAVFGSVGYDITEDLTLTLGLRYTDNELERSEKESTSPFGRTVINSQERATGDDLIGYDFPKINDDRLDPSVSLTYSINDDMSVYGSYGSAYQRAGYNSRFVCEGGTIVGQTCEIDQEEADNYEIGFKSEWLDNRLRFNAVAYYLEYQNLQRSQVVITDANPVGESVTTNVNTESEGLELELFWLVTDWLTWELNAGYQDAKYDDSSQNENVPVASADGSSTILIDARNEPLPAAPEYTLSTSANVDYPLFGSWNGLFRLEFQYRDEYNNNLGPNEALQVDDQTNINFSLGMYQTTASGFSIILRGRNVGDNDYYTNASGFPTIGQFVPLSEPEFYSLEVKAFF